MKKRILITIWTVITALATQAQVTQINSNNSLHVTFQLTSTKAIAVSGIDSSIWVTDGTLAGTVQISPTIKYEGTGNLLSGQLIFRGSTPTTGSEIYITDGTPGGTVLVKDITTGPIGSNPAEFVSLNSFIYFTAQTLTQGRELWRTDGTFFGTTLVKDIAAGPLSSNQENRYHLFSNGSYLLFAAQSAATGVELWKSDGTNLGTNLLVDINTGHSGADSSNPANFYTLNSIVLFTATDATHGNEIWKTDGTAAGTILVKDINPNMAGFSDQEVAPGFFLPLFTGFHTFNNRVYFQANDGSSAGEVWVTDGTSANTTLIKDIISGTSLSFIFVIDGVNLPGKFIFPVSNGTSRSELWESDGTPGGTSLFKSFSSFDPKFIPEIFVPYAGDILTGTFTQPLFQGNKFFFVAGTPAAGYELWLSDGSIGGTAMVKDIYPNVPNGIDSNHISYIYTSNALYFPANDGTNGLELWKSDGTLVGTNIVADIVLNSGGSDPVVSGVIVNGKILFQADNGDSHVNPPLTDLYAVDGIFIPLPISLADFTVVPVADDALLNWHTLQEINSKAFTIQRSFDGVHFNNIGTIAAQGNSTTRQGYTFKDAGIINSIQSVVYYRLLAADIDGKTAYSQVIALKLKAQNWNVRLLANPVLEEVRLAITGVTGNVQVNINDVAGKPVYSNKLISANATISIPVASLPHGIYVLEVTNGTDKKSIRFVK